MLMALDQFTRSIAHMIVNLQIIYDPDRFAIGEASAGSRCSLSISGEMWIIFTASSSGPDRTRT